MDAPPPVVKCPNCGEPRIPGRKRCPRCGHKPAGHPVASVIGGLVLIGCVVLPLAAFGSCTVFAGAVGLANGAGTSGGSLSALFGGLGLGALAIAFFATKEALRLMRPSGRFAVLAAIPFAALGVYALWIGPFSGSTGTESHAYDFIPECIAAAAFAVCLLVVTMAVRTRTDPTRPDAGVEGPS